MKLTIEDIIEYLNKNTNITLLSKEYKNRSQVLKFRCECGNLFETTMSSIKSSKKTHCNKCSFNKLALKYSKTTEMFKVEINNILGNGYTLLDEYKNNKTKVNILHGGYTWNVRPDAIISGKQKCPKCYNTVKKTTDDFKSEVFNLFKEEFEILGEYINTHTKILIKHNKCNNKWEQTPANFLMYKSCPFCFYNGRSKGEKKIEEFLNKNKINFTREYRFKNCKNKKPLPFDFAVFDKKGDIDFLIEYDGIQHYKRNNYWNTLEKTQINDNIKNNYCKDNNIKLIRIPYWDYDNIEKIIKDIL